MRIAFVTFEYPPFIVGGQGCTQRVLLKNPLS